MRGLVLLAALAVLVAPPARAGGVEDAVAEADLTVGCMMKRAPGQLRAYLDTVPGSTEERRIARYMYDRMGWCLRRATSVTMGQTLWRGIVAEHLLKADFASAPPAGGGAASLASFGPLSQPLDVDEAISSAYLLARCTVVGDEAAAAAVLATERGSPLERRRLRALLPVLQRCVAAGQTFRTDAWTLRPLLAEAIYQLYRTRRSGPPSGNGALA